MEEVHHHTMSTLKWQQMMMALLELHIFKKEGGSPARGPQTQLQCATYNTRLKQGLWGLRGDECTASGLREKGAGMLFVKLKTH